MLAGLILAGAAGACASSPARARVPGPVAEPVGDGGRFGWTVRADGESRRQAGYRLVVSTDPYAVDAATAGGVDPNAWDSGLVRSPDSADVRPSGFRFEPGTTYYWRVRVRDEQGRDSPWSALSTWAAPRG
jgi:hypothetical protein